MPDLGNGRRSKGPTATGCGSVSSVVRLILATGLCGVAILAMPQEGRANPKGGQVTAGSATITNSSPTQLDINQSTNRAVIDWQSFDIAVGQRTQFQQPSSAAITLNRVHAADPSTIAGQLTANGSVVLINPSGVVFSKGSQVNVNSIIVTPSDITNANFMAGNMRFDRPSPNPNATVVNAGTITVAQKGLAALVAPSVVNSGVIQARLGKVVLAGAETFTVDFYGDGLINFDVGPKVTAVPLGADGKPVTSLVANSGTIDAPGGTVLLTAAAVAGILANVIDSSGQIAAPTTPEGRGTATLDAGAGNGARLAGTIDVSGQAPGQTGGTAIVTGGAVSLASTAQVKARGPAGGGSVKIGGGPHGTDPGVRNARTTSVAAGALIDASATDSGNGGNITVWSDGSTTVNGTIYAKGGPNGGNGGWVETSGHTLGIAGSAVVDVGAPAGKAGTWLLDPQDLDIIAVGADDGNVTATGVDVGAPDQNTNITVSASALTALTGNLLIEASRNLTVQAALAFTNQTAGTTVQLLAGNNLTVNQPISTAGGALTLGAAVSTDGSTSFTQFNAAGALAINAAIGDANTGNIVLSAGTGGIALAGDVTAAAGSTISLNSTGGITQTAGVVGSVPLLINAVGSVSMPGDNTVGALAAQITGVGSSLTFNNTATDLVIDTVGGVSGITTNSGAVTLSTTTFGGIAFNQPIAASGAAVTLNAAGPIGELASTGTITAATLTGNSEGDAIFDRMNAITNLGTFSTTICGCNGNLRLVNSTALTVNGTVTTGSGDLFLNSGQNLLTVASPLLSSGRISLIADAMSLGAQIGGSAAATGQAALVNLRPSTSGQAINLGATNSAGVLGLTQADLDQVRADILRIGDINTTGDIAIVAPIATPAAVTSLSLVTGVGGGVSQLTGAPLAATNLQVAGATGVTLDDPNNAIQVLAGSSLGTFHVVDSVPLTIGAVDSGFGGGFGVGILTGGPITLASSANTSLTVQQVLDTQFFGGSGSSIALTFNGMSLGANLNAGNQTVTLTSGNGITQTAGVITAGTLTTSSANGQTLNNANTVGAFNATNTTSGNISLTNTASPLTVTGVTQTGGGDVTINNTGALALTGTLSAGGGAVSLISSGTIGESGGGLVSTTGLLTTNSAGGTTLGGANTVGSFNATNTTSGDISLANTASPLTVTGVSQSGGGGVTIGNTGDLVLTGAVNVGGAGGVSLTASTTIGLDFAGTVVSTGGGGQTYNGPVLVQAATTLSDTGNGTITFSSTVDGANALVVSAGGSGAVVFDAVVGGSTPLASLAVSGPTTLDGNITTSGAQTYNSAVTLGATVTLTTTNAAVDFVSTIDGNAAGRGLTVAAGAGTVTLGGVVGGMQPLAGVDLTGPTVIDADVSTTSAQTYRSTVTLGGTPITLSSLTTIDFKGTVDGASALTVTNQAVSGSRVTFEGAVGGTTPLASLTATAGSLTTLSGGSINTSGAQTYNDPVTLGAPATLTTNNAAVDFTGTIDGGFALIVTAGTGAATFGVVGGTTPLASLAVTGGTTLNGNITTTGAQTYNSAVILGNTITLTTTNATVDFVGTVDATTASVQGLTVAAGSGVVTFGGTVGGSAALASLTVTGKTTLDGDVTTTGSQTYNSAATLGGATVLTSTGSGTITLAGTVDGAFDLTVNTGGATIFGGAVGGTTPLASLNATGGTITLGGDVTTTGALTLNSTGPASTLLLPHNLTSGTIVTLNSVGLTSQTAGIITAATLTGNAVGGASLTDANKVNTFGSFTNTGGGLLSFTDARSVATTGTITSSGGGSLTLTTTGAGSDMALFGTETATNVTLVSAGSITETPPVIAATLSVTSVGPVSMADANQVGTLAASVTGAGNGLLFNNTGTDLTIGTVGGLSGITTNGGAVTLTTTTSGNIALNEPIDASSATPIPTVALNSAGTIGQAAAGKITATALSVTDSGGNAVLEAANAVGTVAARLTSPGGALSFNDGATALIVGAVNGLSGITTSNGDINLRSGGLAIDQPLNAGSGNVRLVDAGTISQTSPGTITAGGLSISDSGPDLVLELPGNALGTVAVDLTTAGSAFSFNDGTTALTVGSIAAAPAGSDPSSLFGAVTGVATSNADINLKSAGLAVNQPVAAGTGTVRLVDAGAVSQDATTGAITANSLSVTDSAGNVVLEGVNAAPTVAVSLTGSGAAFSFNDGATALAFGTVAAAPAATDPASIFPAVSNVTTSNGDVNLRSGGLTIDQPLNAGSGIVRLVATGTISQAAGGPITASALSVTDNGGDVLLQATNAVTTTAAIQSTPSGTLSFNVGTQSPEIGVVVSASASIPGSDPLGLFPEVAGESTNNGAIVLTTSGTLTLSQSLNAGSATVTLNAGGAIIQTGGVITAGTLTVSSVGGTSLGDANLVANLGASANADGGGFLFNDARALTITGAVDAGTGNLLVTSTGAIEVPGVIQLTAGENIVLASNGPFTQTGTLTIASPDLVIDTTGKDAATLLDQFKSVGGITNAAVITNPLFKPSGNSNAITFGGALAAKSSIVLLLANKGAITGGSSGNPAINVGQLGISAAGGSMTMFGSIGGNATTTAAESVRINPFPDNNYRFNDCAVGSVTCIVFPALTFIEPQAAREIDVLVAKPAEEETDAPLINIFDEERLCEELLRKDPQRAKEVCR